MFNQIPFRRLFTITTMTICGIALLILATVIIYFSLFGSPQRSATLENFTISKNDSQQDIAKNLYDEGFIKSRWAFNIAMKYEGCNVAIQPGVYKISKRSSPWDLVENYLTRKPNMVWVTIPEGIRKEQIAGILKEQLDWSDDDEKKWVTTYTAMQFDHLEGVYFPDTYLIPTDEAPLQTAQRLQAMFNEKFAPYAKDALSQNIKWDTLLKIASLIQREAAGKDDAPIISGIIWNRLLTAMKLDIDTTVQYTRDSMAHYGEAPKSVQSLKYTAGGDWWKPIKPADKQIDSAYNTYMYIGLPPHPIDNPGTDAIEAALHPTETKCLYYLHDNDGQIHCSETYKEQLDNINKYLKN
jgi:UPF0755 protein